MRKLLLLCFALMAFGFTQAQDSGLKLGVNLGIPTGDASDISSIALGVDLGYMVPVTEKFKAGGTIGYAFFSGKDFHGVDFPDFSFLPIAVSGQYSIIQNLFVGVDLGYAVGLAPDGNDGGFYYQPKFGYQIDLFEVYLGYKGVSVDGGTISSLNIGFNYKF